jgi:hypothetical protein
VEGFWRVSVASGTDDTTPSSGPAHGHGHGAAGTLIARRRGASSVEPAAQTEEELVVLGNLLRRQQRWDEFDQLWMSVCVQSFLSNFDYAIRKGIVSDARLAEIKSDLNVTCWLGKSKRESVFAGPVTDHMFRCVTDEIRRLITLGIEWAPGQRREIELECKRTEPPTAEAASAITVTDKPSKLALPAESSPKPLQPFTGGGGSFNVVLPGEGSGPSYSLGPRRPEPNRSRLSMFECAEVIDADLALRGLELNEHRMFVACDQLRAWGQALPAIGQPRRGTAAGERVAECVRRYYAVRPLSSSYTLPEYEVAIHCQSRCTNDSSAQGPLRSGWPVAALPQPPARPRSSSPPNRARRDHQGGDQLGMRGGLAVAERRVDLLPRELQPADRVAHRRLPRKKPRPPPSRGGKDPSGGDPRRGCQGCRVPHRFRTIAPFCAALTAPRAHNGFSGHCLTGPNCARSAASPPLQASIRTFGRADSSP